MFTNKIYLKDKEGKSVGMSTEDFTNIEHKLEKMILNMRDILL